MLVLIFVGLIFQDSENPLTKDDRAIWIPLDSPLIDLPLVGLSEGNNSNFKLAGDNKITFFFTPTCEFCKRAYDLIAVLGEEQPCLAIFAGKKEDVISFLDEKGVEEKGHVFLVNPKDLVPFNIRHIPAVIGYKDNQLTMAMHGPLGVEDSEKILSLHYSASRIEQ